MSEGNLEKRVEVLEQEISMMREEVEKLKENKKPWWERNAGIFAGDELVGSSPLNRGQGKKRKSQVKIWDDQEV